MEKYFLAVSFLFVFLVSGCAQKIDLGPGYDRMSKDFLQAMRWKDFQGAAAYLKAEDRQKLLSSFNESRDLYIVDAEYQYSRLDKQAGTAESELTLKYYLLPSTKVIDWTWKIDWVLIPVDSKQRGSWQVQGAPPDFP